MPVSHNYISLKADQADATDVRPSDWNANHNIGALSHTEIQDIGINTHLQIDAHMAAAATTYLRLDCANDPLTAALDLPEIYNSLGDLKVMPDVQGGVYLFGDTDVGNDDDGMAFIVNRRAAEGDTYFRLQCTADRSARMDANWDIHIRSNLNFGVIYIGDIINNVVRLVGSVNAIGYGTGTANLPLRHYGYITAGGLSAQKYIQWLVDDADDYFWLTRQDVSIVGFKIDMPVNLINNSLTTTGIVYGGKVGINQNTVKSELHFGSAIPVITSDNALYQSANAYFSAGWKRTAARNPVAVTGWEIDGDTVWWTQSDGNNTVDSAITLAQRMILKNNGDLTVGGTIHGEMLRQTDTWHAYGGFEDQGQTITCGIGDWNHITNGANNLWTLDEVTGITEAADVFTLVNTGDYMGTLSISLSGLNGKDFHVRVYNNTQARVEGRPIGISTTGANNEMNICVPLYIEGTAGDAIQFEIMSADGSDPVVDDGLFYLTYLHD